MFNNNQKKKINNAYLCNVKKLIITKSIDSLIIYALAIIICLFLHIFGKDYLDEKTYSNLWLLFLLAPTIISMFFIGNILFIVSNKIEIYSKMNTDFDYVELIRVHTLQNQNPSLNEILYLRQENLISEVEFQNKMHDYLYSTQPTYYNELIKLHELKQDINISTEELLFKKQCFLNSAEYVSKQKLEFLAQVIYFEPNEICFKLCKSRRFLFTHSAMRFMKLLVILFSMILYIILRSRGNN